MAFAALGAAEILEKWRDHSGALHASRQSQSPSSASRRLTPAGRGQHRRLSYANAAIAEAVIVAGGKLGRDRVLRNGLRMLEWLLAVETRDGHLSVVPAGGWGLGEPRPAFDQQPIEVAALADACMRAAAVTGDSSWLAGVEMSVAWFLGDNDAKIPLLDERTGGGCDGLEPHQPQPQPGSRVDAGDDLRDAAGAAPGRRAAMKASRAAGGLLTRTEHRLRPDASRTLCRLFVPGQETLIRGGSRAMAVIDRVLDLNEAEVERTLARTLARFSAGYRDLAGTLEHNFQLVAHRLGGRDQGRAAHGGS